jgi:hypothetical protein
MDKNVPVTSGEQSLLDKIVPVWLKNNNRSGELKSQAYWDEYYTELKAGSSVNFHSPIVEGSVLDGISRSSFKINLGRGTLKGSRKYLMPSMSLLFTMNDPEVKITTNVQQELTSGYDFLIRVAHKFSNFLGKPDNPSLRKIVRGDISTHPHVSNDLKPCLGYFSEAFASTIASNNITALCSVAFSFICNWTRNDAYWDINNSYREYIDYKTADNFRDYIILVQTMNEISRMFDEGNYNRFHPVQCDRDGLRELKEQGMDKGALYVYAKCLTFIKSDKWDTKDGKIKKLERAIKPFTDNSLKKVMSNARIVNTLNTGPVMDWAIVNNYTDAIGSTNDGVLDISCFKDEAYIAVSARSFRTKIDNLHNNSAHHQTGPTATAVLEMERAIREEGDTIKIITNVMEDEILYKEITAIMGRSANNYLYRGSAVLYAIRSYTRFINNAYGPTIEEEDNIRDIFKAIKQMKTYIDNYNPNTTSREEWSDREAVEHLKVTIGERVFLMLEKLLPYSNNTNMLTEWKQFLNAKAKSHIIKQLEMETREVKDERKSNITQCSHTGSGLHAYSSNSYSEESQLSIETF